MRLMRPIERYVRISQQFLGAAHRGLDLSAYVGTPVYAPADGVAYVRTDSAANGGFGRYVRIETDGYKVYLAHLDTWLVGDGDDVARGDLIGLSGNTGYSSGPHLHLEVRRGGRERSAAIDPEPLLDWGVEPEQPEQPAEPAEPTLYLPINDPLTLGATGKERIVKARYWLEEAERKDEDAMPEYAREIRLALIKQMYTWEREA